MLARGGDSCNIGVRDIQMMKVLFVLAGIHLIVVVVDHLQTWFDFLKIGPAVEKNPFMRWFYAHHPKLTHLQPVVSTGYTFAVCWIVWTLTYPVIGYALFCLTIIGRIYIVLKNWRVAP
jgi:uncharacterized membrane protein YkgB